MELSDLKRSRDMLLSVLRIQKTGHSLKCPFHEDKTPSFSVWQGKEDGVWLWKCNSGCGGGTVIDAAMKVYRAMSPQDAFLAIERELGIKIGRNEELIEPRINHDFAESFVQDAHANLMNSPELQETWMRKKRGIFNLEVIERYRIGFVTPDKFKFNKKQWTMTGWVLPVTNAKGVLIAVKLHTEKALFSWAPTKSPKCVWCPFGTYPAAEPKHGTATLWPAPEDFAGAEKLYICPGELKALAMIGAGMAATSPTAGESALKPELVKRIVNAKPKSAFVVADVDAPRMVNGKMERAGDTWKDKVVTELKAAGVLCYSFSFGKKLTTQIKEQSQREVKAAPQKPIAPKLENPVTQKPVKIPESEQAIPDHILHAFDKVKEAKQWKGADAALIQEYQQAKADDRLPRVPFRLSPHGNAIGQWFFDELDKEIAYGPEHPRAKMGGTQEDLKAILAMLIPF